LIGARTAPVPRPRPEPPAAPASDGVLDLSHAVPMKSLSNVPSAADQFRSLKTEIAKSAPQVATAKIASDTLAREAEALQRKLVATAARVEDLEREKAQLNGDIAHLTDENERLSAGFARDRVSVTRLLAVVERLQHDFPPAMALRPDDALAAARGAMLVGATLPKVYGEAAALARRLDTLRRTRAELVVRRAEAARNAVVLVQARVELDQLLAMKRQEAGAAATRYGSMKDRLDKIAVEAADLQTLLRKVAELQSVPATESVVTVTAQNTGLGGLKRGSLLCPVVGTPVAGGMEGVGGTSAPGLTYATAPAARVISPADGTILFAGPYHKTGLVLILELTDGYDVVLAGLDRLDVRADDHVLAGEPVGVMSKSEQEPRLYFELRQKGRGISPAPYLAVALRKAKGS
jgi:murein hydrolase activator